MPPPSQADKRYACRKPHPLSLVLLSEVFPEGTSEHTALRRDAPFVPPLAHRRGSSARPLEVRVRSTITSITEIDFAKQTFTCSFFLDASWVDAGLRGTKVAQSVNAAQSDQRRGWIVTNEDPAHYYFGPQLALANLHDGDIEESFDVSQDDANADAPALVAYRVSGTATFHALLPLQTFPLDAHTLCIELLSKWDNAHVRLVRNLKSAYRSVVAVERFTRRNEFALSPRVHLLSRTSDPRHSGRGRVYSRLDVQLRVRRKLSFWLWNLWLPLFQFTLMSFASMLVEITWFDARLSITLTMLLTKVSYRFSMDEVLPRISYLTLVDKYCLLCIAVSSVLTVQAIVVCWRAEANPDSVVMRLNNLQLPSEEQGTQRFYMLICGGAWIGFNILLPAAAILWRASQKAAEASLWWSEPRDTVLWVGPVNPNAAGVVRGALQTAFDDAYHARCKALGLSRSTTRSTIASFATVSLHSLRLGSATQQAELDAENVEDESVHAKRPPRRVQVVDVELLTPESLTALRSRGTFRYALPATRSAFVLIELASAGQAAEALELLQEACNSVTTHAALAQASTAHFGAVNGDDGAAVAAPNASPSKPSPSPRTRRIPGFGGVRTLQDVARAWQPDGPRRIVVEQALPEFVHLLAASAAARSAAQAAAATVRAFTREWMAPRRSSETMAGQDAHTSLRLAAQSSGRRPSSGGNGASASACDAKDGSTGESQRPSLDLLGATVRRSFAALGSGDGADGSEANAGGDAESAAEANGVGSATPKPLVSALRKK